MEMSRLSEDFDPRPRVSRPRIPALKLEPVGNPKTAPGPQRGTLRKMINSGRPSFAGIRKCKRNRRLSRFPCKERASSVRTTAASALCRRSARKQSIRLWRNRSRAGSGQAARRVLIFDQFEEVFTLGEENAAAHDPRRAEVAELFAQLADLVENRAPAALQRAFETEPQRALNYEFGSTRARVALALREDYLAQLEEWKATLPSLMRNRMPLRLLTGPQALEAVVRPGRMEGRNLVSAVSSWVMLLP